MQARSASCVGISWPHDMSMFDRHLGRHMPKCGLSEHSQLSKRVLITHLDACLPLELLGSKTTSECFSGGDLLQYPCWHAIWLPNLSILWQWRSRGFAAALPWTGRRPTLQPPCPIDLQVFDICHDMQVGIVLRTA